VFSGILTFPLAHIKPNQASVRQDHLRVFQQEAQQLSLGFSYPAPQQTNTTSASFVSQSTSAYYLIAPEYQPIGELTYQ